MADIERYVQMGCCCGAEWIEDRLEPIATCPWCGIQLGWDELATADHMGIVGPGYIDLSPSLLREIMQNCSFQETTTSPTCSRYDSTIWTHILSAPGTIWEITIEVTSFKTNEQLRSITFVCRLSGTPVIYTSLLTTEQLVFLLAAIARSMEATAEERTPLAVGIFCGAPLEPCD